MIVNSKYGMPSDGGIEMQNSLEDRLAKDARLAYFSMEIGLETDIPTYSGGLGVLAGDSLKSCADLGVPAVGVSLLYSSGYFYQQIDRDGNQIEFPIVWHPSDKKSMVPLDKVIDVEIQGKKIKVGGWKYTIKGINGEVPVIFLDTNLEINQPQDRGITSQLYGGDSRHRIIQEAVLGIGGVKMLRELGYSDIKTFHMNEGHSAFLTLELLTENGWNNEQVRDRCVFTTHTPVDAGFDKYNYYDVRDILGTKVPWDIEKLAGNDCLNMAKLAMSLSRYTNAVSRKHGEVSKNMFPNLPIDYITNGVHSTTWTSDEMAALLSANFPGWENNPEMLKNAGILDPSKLLESHKESKARLIEYVNKHTPMHFKNDLLTIGFARRFTPYKRADLIFRDIDRLANIGKGKIQLVFAGKSHMKHTEGKDLIRRVVQYSHSLKDKIRVVFLENYDMEIGKLMTSGADIWLNTPKRPQEASGTSGMKALHNGVPNFSVLDGWWIEGYEMDPLSGWPIGPEPKESNLINYDESRDSDDLLKKLSDEILPAYASPEKWTEKMAHSLMLAGHFNTHRMVKEYLEKAWRI